MCLASLVHFFGPRSVLSFMTSSESRPRSTAFSAQSKRGPCSSAIQRRAGKSELNLLDTQDEVCFNFFSSTCRKHELPKRPILIYRWTYACIYLHYNLLLLSQQVGIGPGPVFECVRFGINCRSPLLEHYLASHGLIAHSAAHGRGPYVTRTQIKELPYLFLSSLLLENTIHNKYMYLLETVGYIASSKTQDCFLDLCGWWLLGNTVC